MWISLVVPLAVLLAALLLQRLEDALLTAPEPAERPEHPADHPDHPDHLGHPATPLALVPPPSGPPPVRGPAARPSTARATA